MSALWARLGGALAAAGLFLLAILGIYAKGRSDASAAVAKSRLEEDLARQRAALDKMGEAHNVRQEVEKEIRSAAPNERRERLARDWSKER